MVRKFFHRIHQQLQRKRKTVIITISLFHAIFLSLLTYWWDNQAYLPTENSNLFALSEYTKHNGYHQNPDTDVVYVNVAYDRVLVDAKDEYGIPVGNTDITDREKLLTFLQILDSLNTYKYIFLDVRFEKGYDHPMDSALFAQICQMKNIVIPNHANMEIANNALIQKAAFNDYWSTLFESNFVRYQFSYGKQPSMALYAYNELTHKTIDEHELFYISDGQLCKNSTFLQFPLEDFDEYTDTTSIEKDNRNAKSSKNYTPLIQTYHNLGSDVLYLSDTLKIDTQYIVQFINAKYVVVGDMVEDLHNTYSGKRPGPVITYYAFQALMNQSHIVNLWLMALMAIVYFFISMTQFTYKLFYLRMTFIAKSKLLNFLLSFTKYTVLLVLIAFVLNLFWDISISIFIPSVYFAIQKTIINFYKLKLL